MQSTKEGTSYFFIDESGDPTFYNQYGTSIVGTEGCSKILLLGFIKTQNPKPLRDVIYKLHEEISQDAYLQTIPSFAKSSIAFHAKDDCPEIREKVFKAILPLDFKAQFVVARKSEAYFQKHYQGSEQFFYEDLISRLLKNQLHLSEKNKICFASRGSTTRTAPLLRAITKAKTSFETQWQTTITSENLPYAAAPSEEACLQIIDYMNWAVQRAFLKSEDRYLMFVQDKISLITDIFDFKKYPHNYYRGKEFSIKKISPL